MPIVALTFHDVIPENRIQDSETDSFYSITDRDFERLLERLRQEGVKTCNSVDFWQWLKGTRDSDGPTAMLTFDDGYASHLEVAARLLKRFERVGVFFITTDFIGRKGFLSVEQLQELSSCGMEIGSHGKTHQPLNQLTEGELKIELKESKQLLENWIGKPVRSLAIPGGFWSPRVSEVARESGYETVWVSAIGANDHRSNSYALKRVVVHQPFGLENTVALACGKSAALRKVLIRQRLISVLKACVGVSAYEWMKRNLFSNS